MHNMKSHLVLLVSLCAAIHVSAAVRGEKPWFCHDIDCPEFTVQKKIGDMDLRSYQQSVWISTNVSEVHYDAAVRTAFMRLFEYISGANEHGSKIEMTAPVRTKLIAGAGPFCEDTFTVSFFFPFEYQNGTKRPPAPNRNNLFIETTPASSYWVYAYSGWTSEDKVLKTASDVLGRLDAAGEKYDASVFYSAGYDPPFRIINRHNEVWIPAPQAAPSKTVTVRSRAAADARTAGKAAASVLQQRRTGVKTNHD